MNDKIEYVDVGKLERFPDNPFAVREDDALAELTDSITQNGITVPLLVRPAEKEDSYEVIAGQRRLAAAKIAGLKVVPVIIKELNRDEAIIAMVDSNISQRDILPSEKAFAYKMRVEAMNRQGMRSDLYPDLTYSQVGKKLNSYEEISEQTNESRMKIHRYIRLTYLIKPLLDLVDEGRIAISPAVELSFLPEEAQRDIYQIYADAEITPSYPQSRELRRLYSEGNLNYETMFDMLTAPKPNQIEHIRIPTENVSKYFSKPISMKEMVDFVSKAVEFYASHLREKQQERKAKNRDDDYTR